MQEKELVESAVACGVHKAEIISNEKIITSPVFRDICASNACGLYGKCWMCPPDIGEINRLIGVVRQYAFGLWYQTVWHIEDSFDFEGMLAAKKEHSRISREIEAALMPLLGEKYLHLSSGGCGYCQTCSKAEGYSCRFPENARSSLEAYGIDVYNTTKNTALKYINGQDTVTYFGVILFG